MRSLECVIFQTDKSGRFSVDSAENYKLVSETHVAKGVVISKEDYVWLQQLVNAHAVFWTRFLQAGSKTKSATRLKDSMVSVGSPIATLYTLRKDHKVYDNESRGPPVRPVCGAVAGYNHRLAYLISTMLAEVWKSREDGAVCRRSTEEMIVELNKANDIQEDDDLIIGQLMWLPYTLIWILNLPSTKCVRSFMKNQRKVSGC